MANGLVPKNVKGNRGPVKGSVPWNKGVKMTKSWSRKSSGLVRE